MGTTNAIDAVNLGIDTTERVMQLAPGIISLVQLLEVLFKSAKAGKVRKTVIDSALVGEHEVVRNTLSQLVDNTIAAKNLNEASTTPSLKTNSNLN